MSKMWELARVWIPARVLQGTLAALLKIRKIGKNYHFNNTNHRLLKGQEKKTNNRDTNRHTMTDRQTGKQTYRAQKGTALQGLLPPRKLNIQV